MLPKLPTNISMTYIEEHVKMDHPLLKGLNELSHTNQLQELDIFTPSLPFPLKNVQLFLSWTYPIP